MKSMISTITYTYIYPVNMEDNRIICIFMLKNHFCWWKFNIKNNKPGLRDELKVKSEEPKLSN